MTRGSGRRWVVGQRKSSVMDEEGVRQRISQRARGSASNRRGGAGQADAESASSQLTNIAPHVILLMLHLPPSAPLHLLLLLPTNAPHPNLLTPTTQLPKVSRSIQLPLLALTRMNLQGADAGLGNGGVGHNGDALGGGRGGSSERGELGEHDVGSDAEDPRGGEVRGLLILPHFDVEPRPSFGGGQGCDLDLHRGEMKGQGRDETRAPRVSYYSTSGARGAI